MIALPRIRLDVVVQERARVFWPKRREVKRESLHHHVHRRLGAAIRVWLIIAPDGTDIERMVLSHRLGGPAGGARAAD